ncbi:phosphatase and actin regulator 2 [Trichonephila clavipes]|nr:phosphatase and actin regulator 2 [Trichonephila clavipes]
MITNCSLILDPKTWKSERNVRPQDLHSEMQGCGSLVVEISDRGWLVTSSKPVPLKTCRRLEPIVENSACVEVGNTINTCEEVSIRTISTILPAKRVVEDLDGTVESTDTIVKLKTKIENSSTFESDPDFIKTLIQNCIDERVSRNEREVTLKKQRKLSSVSKIRKEVELQRAKNKALSLNPATKVEEKQFKTLNKETATHIGIREAEDWFRPIDLAKECDIYISSKNGSQNQPVTVLIDSGCQIPVLNSSLIRVQTPSEEIITLSSCFGEQRMVEVKPINISLDQHSPSLSVQTAISPTLTEEFIIHPSVYAEIEKLGHAKSDVLLSESGSSLGVHFNSNVSVSSVRKNSSYDLPHVKNFNTRNDLSSLVKNYKCNNIKSTKLKMCIKLKNDIPVCQRTRRLSCSDNPSPMKSKYRRFVLLRRIFQPWQWKRRKKRNRFEQTSRTLQRKISMRSTKDQLVKKDVLMPVKHNVFLWNLPDVEEMPSHDGETV